MKSKKEKDTPTTKKVSRTIRVSQNFWDDCKEKAGLIPLSAVIRKLLEKWHKDEIDLD